MASTRHIVHPPRTIAMYADIAELHDSKAVSYVDFVENIPWHFEVFRSFDDPNSLKWFVCVNEGAQYEWTMKLFVSITVGSKDIRLLDKRPYNLSTGYDIARIDDSWRDFTHPDNGNAEHGKLKVLVTIQVTQVTGIPEPISIDFSKKREDTDIKMLVDGDEIHLNKKYLMDKSSYFNRLLSAPNTFFDGRTVIIKDSYMSYERMLQLVGVMHECNPVTRNNFKNLLKLSQGYEIESIKFEVEAYLIRIHGRLPLIDCFSLVSRYELGSLHEHLRTSSVMNNRRRLEEMITLPPFMGLDSHVRRTITDRIRQRH